MTTVRVERRGGGSYGEIMFTEAEYKDFEEKKRRGLKANRFLRQHGLNPRVLGTNPRKLGTNPKAMTWKNLLRTHCPQCGKALEWRLDKDFFCQCGFKISEQRFKEVTANLEIAGLERRREDTSYKEGYG